MGFNEPYNKGKNRIEPDELVELWRKYFQPTAERLDLDLVSFTTTHSSKNIEWFAEFLHGCHMLENDEEFPCRVDDIKFFSVHNYSCEEKQFKKKYGYRKGKFQTKLSEALQSLSN
jgi:methionyl-tRNA synthetase